MKIKELRNLILGEAKSHVIRHGWNKDLFLYISKSSKFKYEELNALFPNGYKSLLQIYLNQINEQMTKESKSMNLIRLKVHERIRALIITRLQIMVKEKKLISKTFIHLALPGNYKFAFKNLYKAVDQIWFLAGDNSTDFNFYSKRLILGSIYTITLMHFINNDNLDETIKILNKQLKKVSKIPNLKNKIKGALDIIPNILKLGKKFSIFKQ